MNDEPLPADDVRDEEPEPPREVPFVFSGQAGEYFRIWIVNMALTVVTLGIYSAWAKYRTKQYFYRHTLVDGSSFEYLANPMQLLKGRLVVAAALGLLFAAQAVDPVLYFVIFALYVALSPLLLVSALRFNARNAAWRNVTFSFTGAVSEAYLLYVKLIGFVVLTCYLASPYTQWMWAEFLVTKHRFGDQPLEWDTKAAKYFELYLLMIPLVMVIYAILMGVLGVGAVLGTEGEEGGPGNMATGVFLVAFYGAMLVPGAFFKARSANLVFGGIHIGEHKLRCEQKWLELLAIYAGNIVALVCTLGLAYPWAKIRLATYRASRLTLLASGPLHIESADLGEDPGALGDAAVDLGDLDLDLGF